MHLFYLTYRGALKLPASCLPGRSPADIAALEAGGPLISKLRNPKHIIGV